jgi:hypothetical protein
MATAITLIAKNVLGSATASVTFSTIPATYDDLLVICSTRTTRSSATDYVKILPNGGYSNVSMRVLRGDGSSATSFSGNDLIAINNGDTSTADTFSSTEIYIPNYAGSTNKSMSITTAQETNGSTALIELIAGLWSNTTAISSIGLEPNTGPNWKAGSSFFLYGIKKA